MLAQAPAGLIGAFMVRPEAPRKPRLSRFPPKLSI
jgi:hypothetical protein